MQVSGKGWVVTDSEELQGLSNLPSQATDAAKKGMVLVKVKMMKAEYYETRTTRTGSWWQNAFSSVTAWFRSSNNQFRPDIYSPAS